METEEQVTVVTIKEPQGRNIPNIEIEGARFYGRPNFAGEMDRFKDPRRKFTVIIPDAAVAPLQEIGYNVKTTVPDPEAVEQGREQVNHLKVMVDEIHGDKGPDIFVIQGEDREKLTSDNMAIIDRSRFEVVDLEIRAWMYNKEEVDKGLEEPAYSARLVLFVGVMRVSRLAAKYGRLM